MPRKKTEHFAQHLLRGGTTESASSGQYLLILFGGQDDFLDCFDIYHYSEVKPF